MIFDRHYPAVFRFAERRVGHDQAGDVAAEVMTQAFAGAPLPARRNPMAPLAVRHRLET